MIKTSTSCKRQVTVEGTGHLDIKHITGRIQTMLANGIGFQIFPFFHVVYMLIRNMQHLFTDPKATALCSEPLAMTSRFPPLLLRNSGLC